MDITAKGGGTGRWSRRNSLAGNEFLKMDDEVIFKINGCIFIIVGALLKRQVAKEV